MQANVWRNESAAWPVANPVVTCASVSNAGFPSNFVADPFLFVQVTLLLLLNFHFWPAEIFFLSYAATFCCDSRNFILLQPTILWSFYSSGAR